MRTPFIDQNFEIPIKAELEDFNLELLTTKQVEEDLKVLLENSEAIIAQRGGSRVSWPTKCTLEENYKDLAWLEICAAYKQLCSYIIRDPKTNEYLGCFYIYPIELFYADLANQYDVDFSFWIIQNAYDEGNYKLVYEQLNQWLIEEWKFKKEKIYFRNNIQPK